MAQHIEMVYLCLVLQRNNAKYNYYEGAMITARIKVSNVLLHLFAIILVTVIFYSRSINNFFYADDFIWLDRIKHLPGNWSNIFTIENRYFTPLTYISFYTSYKLFGLNSYWYHLQDVTLHSLNGMLLYLLTYLITRNKLTSFIAATAFVTSFSIFITAFWPSARTDLIMVFFSLVTIIAFIRTEETRFRFVPLVVYILALCAKGTALVIPAILFLLAAPAKPFRDRIRAVLPYIATNAAYVSLLIMCNSLSAKKLVTAHNMVSFTNYVRSLPSLIIPERFLAGAGTSLLVTICIIVIITLVGIVIRFNDVLARIGAALAIFGLLPLIFTRDYVLAGSRASAIDLLSSPSNRVYLAVAGISLVYAFVFTKLLHNDNHLSVRIMSGLLLASLLCVNYYEIYLGNKKWSKGTNGAQNSVKALERNAYLLTENSELLLFNFEGSTGFSAAMINTLFDLKKFEVKAFNHLFIKAVTDVRSSPLKKYHNDQDPSRIKLIMNCSGHPHADRLVDSGNVILQHVLVDYREIYATTTAAEADPIKIRLNDNMSNLRAVLNECVFIR